MSAAPSPSDALTYVYCIAPAEPFGDGSPPLRAPAIGGRGDAIRPVRFDDLAAIVSDSPAPRYDISRQHTMAHQLAIEEAMARGPVLPVRFGTLARKAEQVERLLARRSEEFHELLAYVRGRTELGIKVLWVRERLFAEIAAESEHLRALRDAVVNKPADAAYYERLELGRLTEQALARKSEYEAGQILDALRPLAVDTKLNKEHTDMMLLNASFLVDRARESAFDLWVNAIAEANSGRLVLKYAGPLPPFNFVNVAVRWEEG